MFLEESGYFDVIVGNYIVFFSINILDFIGLKKFMIYSVCVCVYFFFGEGLDGEVIVLIDEDGEFLLFDMKVDIGRKFNF